MATWRPILSGAQAAEARRAALEIGNALRAERLPELGAFSLAAGTAGLAVMHAYLAHLAPEEGFGAEASAFWERAVAALGSSSAGPELLGGVSGVAWATDRIGTEIVAADPDPNEDVDALLLELVSRADHGLPFELVSGLVGLGTYALGRAQRPSAQALLERVVAELQASALDVAGGKAWRAALPEAAAARDGVSGGVFNLGVAHGVPGAVALLARACAAGIRPHETAALLDAAVPWLLAQARSGADASLFGYWVGRPGVRGGARLGWCYGDAGVSAALLAAAHARGRADWRERALEIARRAARLAPQATGVVDACLCHGAAGVAHCFNRLHQATGDADLRAGAADWFSRTLAMRRAGEGIVGFRAWAGPDELAGSDATSEGGWLDEPGYLFGAAGVALALASACTELEPTWDGALLLDVSPQG